MDSHTCMYMYRISLKFRHSEILFQGPVQCSGNSRVASTEIKKRTALTISIAAHLHMSIHTTMYIAVDPLPCGEILRAAFIRTICLKVQLHFENSDNSRCGEISRNTIILYMCTCTVHTCTCTCIYRR